MPSRAPAPIVTLTLNPSVDLSFFVDRLAPREKLRCQEPRRDAGGGGVNVARAIRRLGGRAVAVFPAGGPNGERLQAMLKAERLAVIATPAAGETREDFTAEVRATADQYRFVMPGPRLTTGELQGVLSALASLSPAVLVASGSLPPGAPVTFYGRLARSLRSRGAKLALDAAGPALRHGLAGGVWLVKPNLRELEEIVGAPLNAIEPRVRACRSIIESGHAELVALSMGAAGALLVSADQALLANAPAVAAVSTIGAGDSFMGALVLALSTGLSHDQALQRAVAAGSAALLAPGTQLCRASDAKRLLDRVSATAL